MKEKIQKFGSLMSGMVMPNIGIFIAWGILAALFSPSGYFPNQTINRLVEPILKYFLPVLIGYTGGANLYGQRGGVIGVAATIGVVIGSDVTMIIGGMIMGPVAAYLLKRIDNFTGRRIKPGMEMLVDNFSMGILAAILMIIGLVIVGPIYDGITMILMTGVNFVIKHHMLPLVSIFVAPGQLLFLNNAINHGIFVPLAVEQAAKAGKSVLFLVEANGGCWVGLLLAYALFGKETEKRTAPGTLLIALIGGIGEVAYPYALINPLTILAIIPAEMLSLLWLCIMNGGTVAAVSPGSIVPLILMSPKGGMVVNVIAYMISFGVCFAGSSVILFMTKDKKTEMQAAVLDASAIAEATLDGNPYDDFEDIPCVRKKIEDIYFVCDSGMGSSSMGASMLSMQLSKFGINVKVKHCSVSEVPKNADVAIVSVNLYERAKKEVPEEVVLIKINDFLDKEEQAEIAQIIKDMEK